MKKLVIKIALVTVLGFCASTLMAQPPHPGQYSKGNQTHGSSLDNAKAPAGAPVGTADLLLVSLAALYGAYRLSSRRKPEEA